MRAVVQRVTSAAVTVGAEQVSSIGKGLCVLLGISRDDTQRDIDFMIRKLLNLRIFEDDSGKMWTRSISDRGLEILCISQFTLQCILKGNKPDFHLAMPADKAEPFYRAFLEQLCKAHGSHLVKDGRFGARMQVHIQNDGPVTIELQSPPSSNDPKEVLPRVLLPITHHFQTLRISTNTTTFRNKNGHWLNGIREVESICGRTDDTPSHKLPGTLFQVAQLEKQLQRRPKGTSNPGRLA